MGNISLVRQPLVGYRRVNQGQVLARNQSLEGRLKRLERGPVLWPFTPAFAHVLFAWVNR